MTNPIDTDSGVDTIEDVKSQKKVQKPKLYKVLLHNDHYTTREFVVEVLKYFFHRTETDAVQIMLHVHNSGVGVAGVYTFEVAETKIEQVEALAKEYEFPLQLSMEPEDG